MSIAVGNSHKAWSVALHVKVALPLPKCLQQGTLSTHRYRAPEEGGVSKGGAGEDLELLLELLLLVLSC